MTIDSTWIASFKEEAPEAFTPHAPFHPKAVFCDGQIRLMRGHSQGLLTWDDYIWQQFQSHVARFFRNHGVSVVILAFDDYAHVPEAKCMTQLKRRRHLPKLEILAREPLPPVCPCGAQWEQSIANRVFKAKVIARVIEVLPSLLNLQMGQSLIIDYAGCPIEYTPGPDGALTSKEWTHLCPLGEADVKFTRYADIYKDLLVDSVDGDSIPIALLHTEEAVRDLTRGSMRPDDLRAAPPRVCIYRITTRVHGEEARPSPPKRAKGDPSPQGEAKPKIARRTFEYVSIPLLHTRLRDVVDQCLGRGRSASHEGHYMSMLVGLIGLTGTDFSRQMPQVSGRSVYGFLSDLVPLLMASYDPLKGQLDVSVAADRLVAGIYAHKFASHIKGRPPSLESALGTLRASKLSQRTVTSLPSAPQIRTTVRNVNWVLRYWRDPAAVPSPSESEGGVAVYGFVKHKGVVAYADTVAVH